MPNNILIILLFLSISLSAACQSRTVEHSVDLCMQQELLLFGFRVAGKNKYMSLCEGQGEKYLTYRFGTPGNVEFQYPEVLDESSWDKFDFYGYSRGGGVENDAMGDYSISFTNHDVEYTISQNWRLLNDEYSIGILINMGEKRVVLQGEQESQAGSLMLFDRKEKIKSEQQ